MSGFVHTEVQAWEDFYVASKRGFPTREVFLEAIQAERESRDEEGAVDPTRVQEVGVRGCVCAFGAWEWGRGDLAPFHWEIARRPSGPGVIPCWAYER